MKLHQINLPNRIVEYHPCDTWHNLISSNRFRIALNHPDHLQLCQLHASVTITILSSFYKSVSSLSPHVLRTGQAISLWPCESTIRTNRQTPFDSLGYVHVHVHMIRRMEGRTGNQREWIWIGWWEDHGYDCGYGSTTLYHWHWHWRSGDLRITLLLPPLSIPPILSRRSGVNVES